MNKREANHTGLYHLHCRVVRLSGSVAYDGNMGVLAFVLYANPPPRSLSLLPTNTHFRRSNDTFNRSTLVTG
ncbi:hypothetical protein KIN20_013473 [Parelaphostrongylus tenuis]|uniref:Uncharacterized protein n=1 Tax=Parelaphostrongylus tenuis TaxID=148309 RepID=A0AAD5QMM3_PARTN|nr:hypothetical protein KIN20_013473 [Parelaphostrongylus tenuis]